MGFLLIIRGMLITRLNLQLWLVTDQEQYGQVSMYMEGTLLVVVDSTCIR